MYVIIFDLFFCEDVHITNHIEYLLGSFRYFLR